MEPSKRVKGWGADLRPEDRPGVPMEKLPSPVAGSLAPLERQVPTVTIFKRKGLAELTPVFGTAAPPRGLSGLIRRVAYGYPGHKPQHWLLLLMADRVDVMESTLLKAGPLAPLIALGGLAAAAVTGALMPRQRKSVLGF